MTVRLNAQANLYGRRAKVWYHTARVLAGVESFGREMLGTRRAVARTSEVSLHEMLRWRVNFPTVVAIGGNSFGGGLEAPSITNIAAFEEPIITHGNGPQVKEIQDEHPEWTLFQCVVESQRRIGQQIKEMYEGVTGRRGRSMQVEVNLTRVIVAADDPAFNNPTKPIGKPISFEDLQAKGVEEKSTGLFYVESEGSYWREVAGKKGQYRVVVASPKPIGIHPEDLKEIQRIIREGKVPVAVGGGGAPIVMNADGSYKEMEAVIDKDLASALLSNLLGVREMVISTGVKTVAHFFGTDAAYQIDYYQLDHLLRNLKGGTIVRTDLARFGTRADQIWEALIRSGYLDVRLGQGRIQPKAGEALEGFKENIKRHTTPRVTDEDIDLVHEMLQIGLQGQYKAGSMGEKLEAVVNALRGGANAVLITHPEADWIEFEGTVVTRGLDLEGRVRGVGIKVGNLAQRVTGSRFGLPEAGLQRWLVK